MKTLIAYYSLTGTTRKLAVKMAENMKCDVEKIPVLRSLKLDDAKKYDLVLVGTPIWLYAPAFPVSRFLARNKHRLPEVAFFCTYQTTIGRSFEKMERKCGKKPSGTLKLMGPEIATAAGEQQIKKFLGVLRK